MMDSLNCEKHLCLVEAKILWASYGSLGRRRQIFPSLPPSIDFCVDAFQDLRMLSLVCSSDTSWGAL